MRLLKIMMPVVLAAGALCGQDKPPVINLPDNNYDAVIIPVKTLTGDSFDRLVKLLGVFQARMQSDDKLRTIVVYAPRDVVEKMRKVVAELDQPGSEAAIGRNIDMTLTFLRCSTKAPEHAPALPADMEAVAKQLRASTQYKGIELWDTVPLHLQEGKDTTEQLRMPSSGFAPGASVQGMLQIRPEGVTRKDQGRYVRFSKLQIGFGLPTLDRNNSIQMIRVDLNTAGDFMEGQKSVLGKISGIDDETSIFVVISLKVLD